MKTATKIKTLQLSKIEIVERGSKILLANSDRHEIIGEVFGESYSISPARALENAQYIAKCVNMHEELVKVLTVASGHIPYGNEALQNTIAKLLKEAK